MSYRVFDTQYDVIVVGDTLAALAAAMGAGEKGCSVLLVARRPTPGYEVTAALANHLAGTGSKLSADLRAAVERRAAADKAGGELICPVAVEFAVAELLEASNVDLLLYSTPVSVIVEGSKAVGVIVAGKSGPERLTGKVVVDATEDLGLCAAAGALESPGQFSRWATMIMNLADGEIAETAFDADGTEIRVTAGLWSGEAYIRYRGGEQSDFYDLLAPAVLRKVRAEMPGLAEAAVTAMAADTLRCGIAPAAKVDALPRAMLAVGGYAYEPDAMLAAGEAVGAAAAELADSSEPAAMGGATAQLAPTEVGAAWDILVAGGGTAGSLAAVAAAREGVRVAVLEPTTMLGGIATGGGIHCYFHGKPGGLQDELDRRVDAMAPLFQGKAVLRGFNPYARRVVLLQMAREAGVEVIFGTTVAAVETEAIESKALAAAGRNERGAVRPRSVTAVATGSAMPVAARIYLDCTGDGDLAAMAGARFAIGRVGDGCSHAYTQTGGFMKRQDDGSTYLGTTNFDAGYVDPDDVTDLTRARLLGLRHLDFSPWTDEDRWTWITPLIGLRQGRQIVGDYTLTLADQIAGARFDDGIGFAAANYDNHAIDYENESDAAAVWVWMLGQWRTMIGCEIPYRCLLPVGVEDVLVACRALSLTQDAHHQLRMQHDMQRIGEAAALAAVQAIRTGTTPRCVDIQALRETLTRRGCLQEQHRPAAAVADLAAGDLGEILDSDQPRVELWALAAGGSKAGRSALATLSSGLDSDKPMVRFQAAAMLALLDNAVGAAVLAETVRTRLANPIDDRDAAPLWQTAMILLGRCGQIGGEVDASVLCEVLVDPTANARQVIAAVRALARIADPSAAGAVRRVLERGDLEFVLPFRHAGGSRTVPTEDNRWRLELACATALKAMAADDWREIARIHLDDPRAYVRRAARELLER